MTRCLYICSHQTLIDFEVPILFQAGCEVYCVKSLQHIEAKHHTVEAKPDRLQHYDSMLTIPTECIQKLNTVHWYNNEAVDQDTLAILNKYFDFVVCTLLTSGNLLKQLSNEYKGKVCIRLFGREGTLTYEYFMPQFAEAVDKFQFWISYPEILAFELANDTSISKHNNFIIALGVSQVFFDEYVDTWNPVQNKVSFVCSKVGMMGYYTNIFHEFEANFSHLIHADQVVLLGKNNHISRSYLKDNLNNHDFYKQIQTCKAMYYHGKEPRHMHYHPLEAVVIGCPVIFHEESLLASFLPDSPGKCSSMKEAREKIQLILDGDTNFIESVLESQKKCRELVHPKNMGHIFNQVLPLLKRL